jgi:hypothetical protein
MADIPFKDFVAGLPADTIGGSEKIPVIDTTSKHITPALLKTYILALLTASSAVTPTTGDAVLMERAGAEGTFDLDALANYIVARLWTAQTEADPATNADKFVIDRSGTKYRLDIDTVLAYFNATNGSLGSQIAAAATATLADSDEYPLSQGGSLRKATFTNLAARVYAQLNTYLASLAAVTSPADADTLYILQGSTAKKVSLTTLANTYLAAELDLEDFGWDMAAASPAVTGDHFVINRAGTIYKLTIDTLQTYLSSGLQAGVLNFSALASATPNNGDRMVVDDSGTAKKITITDLSTKLWAMYATYVNGLTPVVTTAASDKFYCIQSGTPKLVTPVEMAAYFGATDGDVLAPVATVAGKIPQWSATAKTLTEGLTLETTVRFNGSEADTAVATEKAVSDAIEDITNLDIDGAADIGAALAGVDLIVVDDGAGGTNRKCAMSRVKTFIDTVGTYETIYIDASRMVPCTTAGSAALATHEYGTNDIDLQYLAFDGGATKERAQFKMPMPEGWNNGTVKARFYWSSATGSTAGDTVEWGIKAGALSDSDAIDAALGTPVVISDVLLANNGGDMQVTAATPAMTVGGSPSLGDMIVVEVYRNTDGTDDMTEDAWLMGVMIQYLRNQTVAGW